MKSRVLDKVNSGIKSSISSFFNDALILVHSVVLDYQEIFLSQYYVPVIIKHLIFLCWCLLCCEIAQLLSH